MSRLKIRLLYLLLISMSIFTLLFFIMPSTVTNYSNSNKQKAWRNDTNFGRLFGQETVHVQRNGTKEGTHLTQDVKMVSAHAEEKKKVEMDKDMLNRIESLLQDIKQELNEKEINHETKPVRNQRSEKEDNVIPKVTGQSSKGGDNLVPKVTGQRSKDQRNKISPVLSQTNNIPSDDQKNQTVLHKDILGNLQSVLNKISHRNKPESLGQMDKLPNPEKHSDKTPQNTPSDHSERPKVCDSCFKNDFKYLINPESMCKHSGDLDLLIAVSSSPTNQEARKVIRQTWASTSLMESVNMKCVFFIGSIEDPQTQEQLQAESERYHDIVQLQFKDSYSNLTYKTLSELRWVSEFCRNTKYMMKTDGDMFVNTLILPNILKGAPKTNFIGGHCWGRSLPHREKSSKWFVSYKSYTHSSFPPMCSGTGYIMSIDFVLQILQVSKNIPFFHLEDVFIALCTKKLNVQPVYIDGFFHMRASFDECSYRYRIVTSHEIPPSLLQTYWERMQKCSRKMEEMHYQTKPLYIP
ncbi:UDP-GlcNAc:betaGal beta-1,3-N-acetylglucosaminyltransferase 9-like [Pecten maximus]|uniref:UDP-GlcNAc:betaGal beta-1,3-N-acetylglucosaminyltransferase 9-like n=1 Tax=Pecten maximus TaxID=6579 RepID=UPI0014580A9B|nr:UDP-GlcNAc:betaGal beta-1,3-N-acetylglucosaminyltransferase 9-like [Pecten maximus]XP_033726189.1 UDP-GlcNAc:betaGal beta-1,3-N-acetylglucosaminyltransferase 9-like [Pecten maximus]XP_033726190.1 UDP-GlcNAc:betaGal beta-1,3-N-acetylglucosaminyltransferase 9-like [Pecten maximus]